MPKIEIRERDLTSAGNVSVTTNTVYVPGYANMGPTNTPVLCETVEQFNKVFGSEPYRFKKDQEWNFLGDDGEVWGANAKPTTKFYQAGDYEKSHIMAKELLKLGMPVIYERVFNTENNDDWTASFTVDGTIASGDDPDRLGYKITSTSVGCVGAFIRYTVAEDKVGDSYRYKLTVKRIKDNSRGISELSPVETYITLDPEVSKSYKSTKLISIGQEVEDNSGLVTIKVTSGSENGRLALVSDGKLSIAGQSTDDEFTVKDMYNYLSRSDYDSTLGNYTGFKRLEDKGEYVLKFITSGAYPTFEMNSVTVGSGEASVTYSYGTITDLMMTAAANRGDCTALIDHTPNNSRKPIATDDTSLFKSVQSFFKTPRFSGTYQEDCNIYSAMFTPYGIYETFMGDTMLPASFGYLASFAVQSSNSNGWLATAGVDRGAVPKLKSLCQNLTNAMADSYQPRGEIAINPITNIKPYGLTIWGARTLKNNATMGDLTATSFLNIRQITSDVKRQVYVAAKSLTFEQNNDLLWIRFKNKITPLLDTMVNSNSISSYSIKRQSTDKKATVKAIVRLYAIEPVEDWDITIELADDATEVLG